MSNLDDIYSLLERAHRYEDYIAALCPFHDDTRPSFFVHEDFYYCSSCSKKGKTETLLKYLNRNANNIIQIPIKPFYNPWSTWVTQASMERICIRAHRFAVKNSRTFYMRERGIDIETIKELQIGWKDNWIIFPITDKDGQYIGAVSRAGKNKQSEAKYVIPRGQDPNMLYVPSWKRIEKEQIVFLTFGIIDAISIYQLGYASMSTTGGKRLNPDALQHIRKFIVVIPDKGETMGAMQLSSNLGWRGKVMRIDWKDNMKDVNDYFLNYKNHLSELLIGEYNDKNWNYLGGS